MNIFIRTCMWSIIDRIYKKFCLVLFPFPIKNIIRLFLFKYTKQLSHFFFFYLFSYNKEYEANKYSYSLFSFIVNTFIFLITLLYYKKISICRKFKHLNSNLLKCRSNKKIFPTISVFFYLWRKSLRFLSSFWLELSYAKSYTCSSLTNLCVWRERNGWRWIFFFYVL